MKMTFLENVKGVIVSGMIRIKDVSLHEQVSRDMKNVVHIETEKFIESIMSLSNTIFADMIDWKYEVTDDSKEIVIVGCCSNQIATFTYTVTSVVGDTSSVEDVKRKLNKTIFDTVPVRRINSI